MKAPGTLEKDLYIYQETLFFLVKRKLGFIPNQRLKNCYK